MVVTRNRPHIIYTRISELRQDSTLSNQLQFGKIDEYLITKKRIVARQHVSEVGSAYSSIPKMLMDLCTKKRTKKEGVVIVVYDTSRFSRNVTYAKDLIKRLKENHSKLLVCNSLTGSGELDSDIPVQARQIINEVEIGQIESKNIGRRVSQSIATLKGLGVFFGKNTPYGKKIGTSYILSKLRKVLVSDGKEMRVCRYISIESEKKTPFSQIARTLNESGVTYRGKKWTSRNVKKIRDLSPECGIYCKCGGTPIKHCKCCLLPKCEKCFSDEKKTPFGGEEGVDGWKCEECLFSEIGI